MRKFWTLRHMRAPVIASVAALAMWTGPVSAAVTVSIGHLTPETDPLEVTVSVTDATTGDPVTNLAATDFTVQVDGTTISSPTFSMPPSNSSNRVSVVFVMDMSESVTMPPNVSGVVHVRLIDGRFQSGAARLGRISRFQAGAA